MDIKSFLCSRVFKNCIIGLGLFIVLLLVFKAGELVGFKKAGFSYALGENYYRSFAGPRRGIPMDFEGRDFLMGHGTAGSVIKVSTSTLFIKDRDGTEKVIIMDADAEIRRFREEIAPGDIKINDQVVVIGSPNDAGQIEAKLIRVLPPPPFPFPPPPSSTQDNY